MAAQHSNLIDVYASLTRQRPQRRALSCQKIRRGRNRLDARQQTIILAAEHIVKLLANLGDGIF